MKVLDSSFSPFQLFARGMQGAWFEPRQGYMWQENTGVTATTSGGQTIGKLVDLSAGRVASQATAANRPTLQYNGNLPLIRHADSTDVLVAAMPDLGGGVFSGRSDFTSMGVTARNYNGLTQLNNDVYTTVYNGDVYKQTNCTGDFEPLGLTSRGWSGIATLNGHLYACVMGGDIYQRVNNTGDFIPLGAGNRNWQFITTIGNDLYAGEAGSGHTYKCTNGVGAFIQYTTVSRGYGGLAECNGHLFAVLHTSGEVYIQRNKTGNFTLFQSGVTAALSICYTGKNLIVTGYRGAVYISNGVGPFVVFNDAIRQYSGLYMVGDDLYTAVQAQSFGIQKIVDINKRGSVYFGTPQGMSALHNQSIETTYTLPALNSNIYGWCVFPSRLTPPEEQQLENYFLAKAGISGSPNWLLDNTDIQLTDDAGELLLAG